MAISDALPHAAFSSALAPGTPVTSAKNAHPTDKAIAVPKN
jgi:hypothetical protein